MTAIQPSEKFGVFLRQCGLPAAMAVCQGELCEDYLESASLRDCLGIYYTLNTKHEIMPVLERIIQSKCHNFKDWQLVYDSSATKNLHSVALFKMCELADSPYQFNELMHKILHLDKSFTSQLFGRFLAAADSFGWLSSLYYNYVNSSNYQLYAFRQPLLLKMFDYAKTCEDWQKLYYLTDKDYPAELMAQIEDNLITLSAEADFKQLLSLANYAKTTRLQEHVMQRLIALGTFKDWADTYQQYVSRPIPNFYSTRTTQLLKLAETLSNWLYVYLKMREEQAFARAKLISLARSFVDWQYLLENYFKGYNSDSDFEKVILTNLCQQAQTWKEWVYVLQKTEYKPEFHDQALQALLKIDNSLDKWKGLIIWAASLYATDLQHKMIAIARDQLEL